MREIYPDIIGSLLLRSNYPQKNILSLSGVMLSSLFIWVLWICIGASQCYIYAQVPGTASFRNGSKNDFSEKLTTPNENFSPIFQKTACGLKYTTAKVLLANRFNLISPVAQPAALTINELPCPEQLEIEKAYLYWMVESYAPINTTVTFKNPQNLSRTYTPQMIGHETPGRCWACDHTQHFRADVTDLITQNGQYLISGLPVNNTCVNGDTDGAFLIIIYRQLNEQSKGTISLYDGIMLTNTGRFKQTIGQLNPCEIPSVAKGFAVVGDFQSNAPGPWGMKMGDAEAPVLPQFFNVETRDINLTAGQPSFPIEVFADTDCFSWIVAGVYFQTNCSPICPGNGSGVLTAAQTICSGNSPNSLSLSNHNGNILRWEKSEDNGISWSNISNTTSSYSPPNLTTTTSYRILLQGGGCSGNEYTNIIKITVTSPPVGGAVSQSATICPGQNAPTLTLAGHIGNIIKWEESISCNNVWTTIDNTNTTFQPGILTLNTCFRSVVSFDGCSPVFSTPVQITVRNDADPGIIFGPNRACANTAYSLTLQNQVGNILYWEKSITCPEFTNPIIINNTTNTLQQQATITPSVSCFRAIVSIGEGCAQVVSPVFTVNFDAPSNAGLLSSSMSVCGNQPFPDYLRLSGSTGEVLRWEKSETCFQSGNPIIISHTELNYLPDPILIPTCFRVIVKNGICAEAISNIVNIQLVSAPQLSLYGSPICKGSPLPPLILTNLTGTVQNIYFSSDNFVNENIRLDLSQMDTQRDNTTFIVRGIIPTSTGWFRLEIDEPTCETNQFSNSVLITVRDSSISGTLSSDRTICKNSSSLLLLTGSRGNVIAWEKSIDNGNSWQNIAHTSTSYETENLTITTKFRVKIKNTPCPEVISNEIIITVIPETPLSVLSRSQTLCPGEASGELSVSGNSRVIEWQKDEGNGWVSLPDTSHRYMFHNLTVTTHFRALTGLANCPDRPTNSVTITLLRSGEQGGILSSSQTICNGQNANILNLNGYSGTILRWESSVDEGISWQTIAHTSSSYLPPLLIQKTRFRVAIVNESCPIEFSSEVNIFIAPTGQNGILNAPNTVCANTGGGTLSLAGNIGNIIRWEKSFDQINYSTINNTSNSYNYSGLFQDTYFRVVTQFAGCPETYSNVIKIEIYPSGNVGVIEGLNEICFGDTPPELTLKGHDMVILRWESSLNCPQFLGAISLGFNTSSIRPVFLNQTTCFRVILRSNNCPEVYSPIFTVKVNPKTIPGNLVGTNSICKGSQTLLTLQNNNGKILKWELDHNNFSNPESIQVIPGVQNSILTPNLTENTCFRVLVKNETCSSMYTPPFCITPYDSTIGGVLTASETICEAGNTKLISLSNHLGNVIRWEKSTNNFRNVEIIASTLSAQNFYNLTTSTCFRVLIQNGPCAAARSLPACVTVIPRTLGGKILGRQIICESSESENLTLTQYRGSVRHWESSTDHFLNDIQIYPDTHVVFTTPKIESNICFRAQVMQEGCPAAYSEEFCFEIIPPTNSGNILGPDSICGTNGNILLRLTDQRGSIVHWEKSIDGFNNITTIVSTISEIQTPISETTCFRALIKNGICPGIFTLPKCVKVNRPPVAGTLLANQTICSGDNTDTLKLIGYEGEIIRWEQSKDHFVTYSNLNNRLNTLQIQNLFEEICYRAVIFRGACGEIKSNNVCITIEIPPQPGEIIGNRKVCTGNNYGVLTLLNYQGNIERWECSYDSFATHTIIPNQFDFLEYENLTRTTYFRAVVRRGNCKNVYSKPIKMTVSNPNIDFQYIPIECHNDNNAKLIPKITGAIAPYIFMWYRNSVFYSTDSMIQNLAEGNYRLVIYDSLNCKTEKNIKVENPALFSIAVGEIKNLTCNKSKDGIIKIIPQGGVSPYIFKWSNGKTTSYEIRDFEAGEYAVTVTDANGCQRNLTNLKVTEPTEITAALSYINHNNCNGQNSGAIGHNVSGGKPPYYYQWSSGQVTEDLENLKAGLYTITVTDALGCRFIKTYSVKEPDSLKINLNNIVNPSCGNTADGQINTYIFGGTPPYRMFWSNGFNDTWNKQLSAGDYLLKVFDSKNCRTERYFRLTTPDILGIEILSQKMVSCPGETDGNIKILPIGGVPPYSANWKFGNIFLDGFEIKNLQPGEYILTLTDGNGCIFTDRFLIESLPKIKSVITHFVEPTCFGMNNGEIALDISGGTPPYRYHWSNGENHEDIQKLKAGIYSQTITDAKGCVFTQSFTVSQPEPLVIDILEIKSPDCGEQNGKISIVVNGGTVPYNYSWSGTGVNPLSNSTIYDNLPGGDFVVFVSDSNGCHTSQKITLTENPGFYLSVTENGGNIQHPRCYGEASGNISVAIIGGKAPFQFIWNTGAQTSDLQNITAGEYEVIVTDANGCKQKETYIIHQDEKIYRKGILLSDATCSGKADGYFDITFTGGRPPYRYQWSNGQHIEDLGPVKAGTYIVTVTDANQCIFIDSIRIKEKQSITVIFPQIIKPSCGNLNGSIQMGIDGGLAPYRFKWYRNGSFFSVSKNISNLEAGKYIVIVTDISGCESMKEIVLEYSSPVKIQIIENTSSVCGDISDNLVEVKATGGKEPIRYHWSHGPTEPLITGISPGGYLVTAIDADGCESSLEVIVAAGNQIKNLTVKKELPTCKSPRSGKISIDFTGGNEPVSYLWNTGAKTKNLNSIPSGTYQLTITDAKGCIKILDSIEIKMKDSNIEIKEIKNIPPKCGNANGKIWITTSGGRIPYSYSWSNGCGSSYNENITAGSYTVTVRDADGCEKIATFLLQQTNPNMTLAPLVIDNKCYGKSEGKISLNISGGVPPFRILWTNGRTQPEISNLPNGNYGVIIIDAEGCLLNRSFTIKSPPQLSLSAGIITPTSCGNCRDGKVILNISGGNPTYEIKIDNQILTTENEVIEVSGLMAERYPVFLKDTKGCEKAITLDIPSGGACKQPPTVNVNPKSKEATIYWSQINNISGYELRWRKVGSSDWIVVRFSTFQHAELLRNLSENTRYEYQMRTLCGDNFEHPSDWSNLKTFTTLKRKDSLENSNENDVQIKIYPNPNDGIFTLSLPEIGESDLKCLIKIFDGTGKKIYDNRFNVTNFLIELDLRHLSQGIYITQLEIYSSDKIISKSNLKFIIEK